MWLNTAPFSPRNEKQCQGWDHMHGKKHRKAMNCVGSSLFTADNIAKCFDYIKKSDSRALVEDILLDECSPLEAFKLYTKNCGGDPEMMMIHCAPPPPPVVPPGPQRGVIKEVIRNIQSRTYGHRHGKHGEEWITLLCCYDDSKLKSQCKRQNCPFYHANVLALQQPDSAVDFFKLIPCCHAGMTGGCRFHKDRLASKSWAVDPFQLADKGKEPAAVPPTGTQYIAVHDQGKWQIIENQVEDLDKLCKLIEVSVHNFLCFGGED